jgi:hypothetical protein
MAEKAVGYVLLLAGIATIIFAALSVYFVFTKRQEPIQLFNFRGISINADQLNGSVQDIDTGSLPPEQAAIVEQILKPQKKSEPTKIEIMPADILNDTSNVFAHIIFMGFIASLGYKVANLGTNLLRPVVVKLKEDKALKAVRQNQNEQEKKAV